MENLHFFLLVFYCCVKLKRWSSTCELVSSAPPGSSCCQRADPGKTSLVKPWLWWVFARLFTLMLFLLPLCRASQDFPPDWDDPDWDGPAWDGPAWALMLHVCCSLEHSFYFHICMTHVFSEVTVNKGWLWVHFSVHDIMIPMIVDQTDKAADIMEEGRCVDGKQGWCWRWMLAVLPWCR